ncbi:MAG: glycosyltransferase [Dysgonamonadaceae bacterium]|jgi:glycosyltransferase involved in cell wall biosynthesis|nr:glycosyltransferase [Dysgonamonadaceae bacterium]
MKKHPEISLVMPVYNGVLFLKDAIESILSQSFEDFEFVIVDDCSTDESIEIISLFKDPRIILIKNENNLGIAHSRNIGIKKSTGNLIAFMDNDDLSMKDRLLKQRDFMCKNPSVDICGTRIKIIDQHGNKIAVAKRKQRNELLKIALFLGETSIAQTSIIVRKSFLNKYNLFYDVKYTCAEDYDFLCRCSLFAKMHNLEEELVHYRIHPNSTSSTKHEKQKVEARLALKKYLSCLGVPFRKNELQIHYQLSLPYKQAISLESLKRWLEELKQYNKIYHWYSIDLFEEEINKKYKQLSSI